MWLRCLNLGLAAGERLGTCRSCCASTVRSCFGRVHQTLPRRSNRDFFSRSIGRVGKRLSPLELRIVAEQTGQRSGAR